MYDDDNNFEKYPGIKPESVGERELAPEEDFNKAFETGVPEFAGNQFGEKQFGQATPENLYYGEAKEDVKQEYKEDGAQEEAVEVEKNDDELEKETKTNEADALEEKKKPDNGLNPEILQKQM